MRRMFEHRQSSQPQSVMRSRQRLRRCQPDLHRNVFRGRIGQKALLQSRPFRCPLQSQQSFRFGRFLNREQRLECFQRKLFRTKQNTAESRKEICLACLRREQSNAPGGIKMSQEPDEQLTANPFQELRLVKASESELLHMSRTLSDPISSPASDRTSTVRSGTCCKQAACGKTRPARDGIEPSTFLCGRIMRTRTLKLP